MEKYYLNEDEEYEEGVPSITTYFDGELPNVVERYFTRFYYKRPATMREKPTGENEDHLILYHSNRICMIGIAKSHVALSKGVESISFDIGNCDRSKNEVKGKHKRGGLNLQPTTTLAILKCKDGSEYKVASGIFGTLLETNDRLAGNLEKLSEEGYGYIAIAYTKPDKCDKVKSSLITEQDYNNSTSTESPADPKLEII